jgi:DNA adenine methylase
MSAYHGGKGRIGKQISEVIIKFAEKHGYEKADYWEPFVGMCGVIRHIKDRKRHGSDIHKDIIYMWKALQRGWQPPKTFSRIEYQEMKVKRSSAKRGYIGHVGGFNGIFFGSWAGSEKHRDYLGGRYRAIQKVTPMVKTVQFDSGSYNDWKPKNLIIYCDPPYEHTTWTHRGKKQKEKFDYAVFWNTMRKWSKNNLVFVSGYSAPDDFTFIWKKNWFAKYGNNQTKRKDEYLFVMV